MRFPFHSFLLGIYLVLLVYSQNRSSVSASDVILPLAAITAATLGFLIIVRIVTHSWQTAGSLTSIAIVVLFSLAYVVALRHGSFGDQTLDGSAWFVIGGAALLAGVVGLLARRTDGARATVALNLACALLVATVIPGIAAGTTREPRARAALAPATDEPLSPTKTTKRDIYHVILDRYASQDTMRAVFGFDNRPFLNALRERGFFVPVRSNSNYPRTNFSLASSLNMDHLHDRFPRDSNDLKPVSLSLVGNRVSKFLQSKGYEYVFIASRYYALREDLTADVNYRFKVGQAPLPDAASSVPGETLAEATPKRRASYEHPFFALDRLHAVARMPETTFTFSHFAFPHDPYVAYPDGTYKPQAVAEREGRLGGYPDHVRLINRKILELIDELLDVPEAERPIIVLQADEGPWPPDYKQHWPPIWDDKTHDVLTEKFGILNAYYLPGTDNDGLYESITPVNSFRVVFNNYFGTKLPLLPDESYVFPNLVTPFRFIRVTDEIGRF